LHACLALFYRLGLASHGNKYKAGISAEAMLAYLGYA
jgi:hypothetical protein